MSPRQATPTRWRSGWCGTTQHERCRGHYGGAPCSCACHIPPPEPEPPAVCHGCGRPLDVADDVGIGKTP